MNSFERALLCRLFIQNLSRCLPVYVINLDTRVCPERYFLCTNRRCIEADRHCNGLDDCGDNSDELDCSGATAACPPGHFECSNGHCINSSKVCKRLNYLPSPMVYLQLQGNSLTLEYRNLGNRLPLRYTRDKTCSDTGVATTIHHSTARRIKLYDK